MVLRISLTAAALSLGLAGAAQAGTLPVVPAIGQAVAAPVQTVQYWGYDEDDYYVPAPPRRRYDRPPPAYGYYGGRPAYGVPSYGSPSYGSYGSRGYYNREAAKEYVKDYRRGQKEMFKERVRGWNRAHGY